MTYGLEPLKHQHHAAATYYQISLLTLVFWIKNARGARKKEKLGKIKIKEKLLVVSYCAKTGDEMVNSRYLQEINETALACVKIIQSALIWSLVKVQ